MFKSNDRPLIFFKRISDIIIFILALLDLFIAATLLFKVGSVLLFFITIIIGAVSCFFTWLFLNLFMSYLCDIKLIRNKLYGANNDNLYMFLDEENKDDDVKTNEE